MKKIYKSKVSFDGLYIESKKITSIEDVAIGDIIYVEMSGNEYAVSEFYDVCGKLIRKTKCTFDLEIYNKCYDSNNTQFFTCNKTSKIKYYKSQICGVYSITYKQNSYSFHYTSKYNLDELYSNAQAISNKITLGTINLNDFEQAISNSLLKIINNEELGDSFDKIFNEEYKIIKEKENENKPRYTKEALNYAFDINTIEIEECTGICCFNNEFRYNQATFEEFCSYLYWKTQTRKFLKQGTPIAFLKKYLYELCNFAEYENVDSTFRMLSFLKETYGEDKRLSRQINVAFDEFTLLYCNNTDFKEIYNITDLVDGINFENEDYANSYEFMRKYFIVGKKNNIDFNPFDVSDDIQFYKKTIPNVITQTNELFKQYDINLINLWLGKSSYFPIHFKYIDQLFENYIVDKNIKYNTSVNIIKVSQKDGARKLTFFQNHNDCGPCFWRNREISNFILLAVVNEFYSQTGRKLLNNSISYRNSWNSKDTQRNEICDLFNRMCDILNSDDFNKIIHNCVQKNYTILFDNIQ